MDKLIYLDNNATTKVDERVLEEMMPYFKEEYANPSSMYDFSKKSSHAIREARGKLKDFLGAENEKEIIFTSCGSESANTAIRGALANSKKKHIITTKIEHPCVLNVYKYLEKQGYKVDYIGVNSNGELNTDELSHLINDDTALVSVMWANNETGVINPVKEISQIIKSKNPETKFFVDGVQAAGKVPINVVECGIDMLGISGHKLHAPKGIGALYVNSKTMISPLIIGGHQERGKRAGTENVPYIVGLGKAAELATDNLNYEMTEVARLRDKLEKGILHNIYNARVNTGPSRQIYLSPTRQCPHMPSPQHIFRSWDTQMFSSLKPLSSSPITENRIIAGGPTTIARAEETSRSSISGIYFVTRPTFPS